MQLVLNVAMRTEDERSGRSTRTQFQNMLSSQVMQPGQPISAGTRDDTAMGKID
jgi:hypothetical protein